MKICLLSDIHGNYEALKECIREAKELGVKRFISLGDYVGYYYEPHKCIDLLLKINATCIRGNHENIFLDTKKDKKKLDFYVSKYGNGIKIALLKLKNKHIKFLKKLPKIKKINLDGKKAILCHGSPWSTDEYIYPNKFSIYKERLKKFDYDFIFLGHTHYQMEKKISKKIIINPGSVGQPRDGGNLAKWAILDTSNNKCFLKKTKFNREKVIKQVIVNDKSKKSLIKYFLK